MEERKYNFGIIGLGTMGRNLAYNMCDHGFSVAGFDKNKEQVDLFSKEGSGKKITGTSILEEFIRSLNEPRVIILLVPAGSIVDAVINELKPVLSENDLLIDCGNSHYTDTDKRTALLAAEHIHFMGVGISGGEEGARFGPSIMPGGDEKVYERIASVLEAIAAKVGDEPCVTYLGSGSAGHYVKMVHNGIEYGLMQLISETYHLLKVAGGLNNTELHAIFDAWNKGRLNSFLIEITSEIFVQKDELSSGDLIDHILDTARQKGTGKWASQDAMDIGVPVPAIDASVTARELSAYRDERMNAAKILQGPSSSVVIPKQELIASLEDAFYFSMITTYAQGMALLYYASEEYKYGLKLEEVAKIWRGGCIIRSAFLKNVRSAYANSAELVNIMVDAEVSKQLIRAQENMRKVVTWSVNTGIPVPAMMASLAYYDGYRSAWLPSNLVQAQRDFFGAHTYQRIDKEGVFHTQWGIKDQNHGTSK